MPIAARLAPGETLGDRVLRVDHAGEHGAVCVYRAQLRFARWTAPGLLAEIEDFIAHEMRHRALFATELARRGQARCLSYPLCAVLGTLLGTVTGLLGRHAIAATTVVTPAPIAEPMRIVSRMAGTDILTSTIRMMMLSVTPPK